MLLLLQPDRCETTVSVELTARISQSSAINMSLGAQQTVTSRIVERLKGRPRDRVVHFRFFCPYARYIINRFWFVCPGNELFLRPGGPDARIAETYGPASRSTYFRRRRRRLSSTFLPTSLTRVRKGTRDASEVMTQLRKCYRYYVPPSFQPHAPFIRRAQSYANSPTWKPWHARFVALALDDYWIFGKFVLIYLFTRKKLMNLENFNYVIRYLASLNIEYLEESSWG